MDAIIANIGTLAGVIVGGFANHFISKSQFNREKEWKKNLLIKDKLEEIATTVEEIVYQYKKWFSELLLHVEYNRIINFEEKLPTPLPTPKLTMLIDFYAPDLRKYLDALNAEIESYGEIIAKAITRNYECEKNLLL